MRLVSPTETRRTAMHATFETPLDLTTTALSLGVRLNRAAEETVVIRALAPDEQNQLAMPRYLTTSMGTVRFDLAPGKTIGSPDPTTVRGLSITSETGTNKPLDFQMGALRLREVTRRQRGAVMLTFDDGDHTHFDTAKPILDEFGYSGVAGVVPWWVGQKARMSRTQLHAMAADGWEMASHPQIHDTPLPTLSKARQRKTIERSKRWFLEEGFDSRGQTLIWPFGKFDQRTLDLVGRYHRLAFGGGSVSAPWPITDPGWVPRVNGDNPEAVRHAIDMAVRFGTVVTVMYHTIGESRISTTAFRNELRYIKQADVDVVVPSEVASAQPY